LFLRRENIFINILPKFKFLLKPVDIYYKVTVKIVCFTVPKGGFLLGKCKKVTVKTKKCKQ